MRLRFAIPLFLSWLIAAAPAWADRVSSVAPDGVVLLQDGKRLSLAGIELMPEGVRVLRVLLAEKEVEVRPENSWRSPGGIPAAYLFVTLRQESWEPRAQSSAATENTVMVNELLLTLGAARLARNLPAEMKVRLEPAEKIARQKGEGVWSYAEESGSNEI